MVLGTLLAKCSDNIIGRRDHCGADRPLVRAWASAGTENLLFSLPKWRCLPHFGPWSSGAPSGRAVQTLSNPITIGYPPPQKKRQQFHKQGKFDPFWVSEPLREAFEGKGLQEFQRPKWTKVADNRLLRVLAAL